VVRRTRSALIDETSIDKGLKKFLKKQVGVSDNS
jgi:hypothetical protein